MAGCAASARVGPARYAGPTCQSQDSQNKAAWDGRSRRSSWRARSWPGRSVRVRFAGASSYRYSGQWQGQDDGMAGGGKLRCRMVQGRRAVASVWTCPDRYAIGTRVTDEGDGGNLPGRGVAYLLPARPFAERVCPSLCLASMVLPLSRSTVLSTQQSHDAVFNVPLLRRTRLNVPSRATQHRRDVVLTESKVHSADRRQASEIATAHRSRPALKGDA